MRSLRIWILVADGARARFLQYIDKKRGASTIDDQVFSAHAAASHDIGSDRPGRSFESKGSHRHALEPRVDLHEEKERQFLAGILRKLEEADQADAFDKLFVLAPPRALGSIRELMPERLRAKISGEIAGDYTKHDDKEISRLVTENLDVGRLLA